MLAISEVSFLKLNYSADVNGPCQRIKKLELSAQPERQFLERCLPALRIRHHVPILPHDNFMISPFDVVILHGRVLGEGGCAKVVEGHWHVVKVAIKLFIKVPQSVCLTFTPLRLLLIPVTAC